ncbi:probable ATP-dependent RNA helicase DHX40 [Sycon ciliatum]|uniref:probable ATP-dependent RNA helicase DHX40 n=1 Tax=Sycon ciliatum TaxID=27933 RepID=UPI0031F6CD9F
MMGDLPISACKERLLRFVSDNDALVVVGATGSGKTTQLPQFLLDAGYDKKGIIGVTQPRRIAAISVASRVCEERKCRLGEEVGYHVRFDDCTSQSTVLKYMTDGCLLREQLTEKCLSRYSVLVLDEAHERGLDTDVLFGLVKQLFMKRATDPSLHVPKIVVMSATLDAGKFSEFFDDCPVCEVEGRLFPVDIVYRNVITAEDLKSPPSYSKQVVDIVVDLHLEEDRGDILVFLTGQAEIEAACDKIHRRAQYLDYDNDCRCADIQGLLVLPCYGSMSTEQQCKIFDQPPPAIRRVIVATNIAGTSLTISGVRFVVDSGFAKQLCFNPRTGLDALQVNLISRSEAIQRAGRAGRTSAGQCHRIYSRDVFETTMGERIVPEIQRTSLTSVVLQLKAINIDDVIGFQYMDAPQEAAIAAALKQLFIYDALDKHGAITSRGRQMVSLPLRPDISSFLLTALELDCVEAAAPIAAMLSVEGVFIRPGGQAQGEVAAAARKQLETAGGGNSDFATLLAVFQRCNNSESPARWCKENFVHFRALKMAHSVHQQIETILRTLKASVSPLAKSCSLNERLRRALSAGYCCNVARKSSGGRSFRTMDGHCSTAFIHPSSALCGLEDELDWIIYHDIVITNNTYMRTVCPVRYEWVKDYLPRQHDIDVAALSGGAILSHWSASSTMNRTKRSAEPAPDGDSSKLARRNTDSSISAAKQRYLDRCKVQRPT